LILDLGNGVTLTVVNQRARPAGSSSGGGYMQRQEAYVGVWELDPGARSGSWLDEDNFVTACWPCNTGKADLRLQEVGWTLLSADDVRSDWDGLAGATIALWERAGRPDIYSDWRRALSLVP
jgi:hypothetical protein